MVTQHDTEPTRFSGHLILFYASCAFVSIGAAMAAMGFVLFTKPQESDLSTMLKVLGILFCVAGLVGAPIFLTKARRSESTP